MNIYSYFSVKETAKLASCLSRKERQSLKESGTAQRKDKHESRLDEEEKNGSEIARENKTLPVRIN